MANKPKLFLIDAYAIIYRAYFAFGNNQRYNSKGLNTSTTLGFTNTLLDVLNNIRPSHVGVVFDAPGDTFRNDIYPEYKANREAMPEDIRKALPYVKKIIEGFNIPTVEKVGYEADDVIGTVAKKAEREGYEVYLMTPDKDFAQLVTENILLYRPGRSGKPAEVWGIEEVKKKFEVAPAQVIDILGLWGDAVDNIPGIPGIGEKTSKKLVNLYGSVEGLIEHKDELKGKQKENVTNFAEQGLLSKKLATIEVNVPVDFDLETFVNEPMNRELLKEVFAELEFRTLSERVLGEKIQSTNSTGQTDLFSQGTSEEPEELQALTSFTDKEKEYVLVESKEDIQKLVEQLQAEPSFCMDTETTGLDSHTAAIVGMSISWKEDKAYYVAIPENQEKEILELFSPVFGNPQKELAGQNIKYDINILKSYGISINNSLFDTMIAHYLLQPDLKHNMDFLSETYLSYRPISIETLIGKKGKNQKSMRDIPVAEVKDYACEDADITWQLKLSFEKELEKVGLQKLFKELEMPLIHVLSDMELAGVSIDTEALKAFSLDLQKQIEDFEKSVLDQAGMDFNVGSPKQLGEVLFDHLKIVEKPKKTKSGQYQTNEETLQKLADKHPIVKDILEFRQLKKLKSTYVDALPELINPKTKKIHTSFNQAIASTGRLSSTNPNLQNIPIKTERGREVRKAFIASEGNELLAADYSQVELRLMAEMSQDEGMLHAFQEGLDIHSATASKVFDVSLEEVDRGMRSKAKMVNFGIIYGISAFGLSERLGIPRKEAKSIIENYFTKYPKVASYMSSCIEIAKEKGYVETIMGRRRYLKDINSRNAVVRGYAERNAINAPIQGSAADIIKKAMIDIQKEIIENNWNSKMIIQVHDELIFDVFPEEKDKLSALVKCKMQNAVKLSVPLDVDMNFGKSWLEAH